MHQRNNSKSVIKTLEGCANYKDSSLNLLVMLFAPFSYVHSRWKSSKGVLEVFGKFFWQGLLAVIKISSKMVPYFWLYCNLSNLNPLLPLLLVTPMITFLLLLKWTQQSIFEEPFFVIISVSRVAHSEC
jgi:hypothetical protein